MVYFNVLVLIKYQICVLVLIKYQICANLITLYGLSIHVAAP